MKLLWWAGARGFGPRSGLDGRAIRSVATRAVDIRFGRCNSSGAIDDQARRTGCIFDACRRDDDRQTL